MDIHATHDITRGRYDTPAKIHLTIDGTTFILADKDTNRLLESLQQVREDVNAHNGAVALRQTFERNRAAHARREAAHE